MHKLTKEETDKMKKLQKQWIKKNGKPVRHNDLDINVVSLYPKQMHSKIESYL